MHDFNAIIANHVKEIELAIRSLVRDIEYEAPASTVKVPANRVKQLSEGYAIREFTAGNADPDTKSARMNALMTAVRNEKLAAWERELTFLRAQLAAARNGFLRHDPKDMLTFQYYSGPSAPFGSVYSAACASHRLETIIEKPVFADADGDEYIEKWAEFKQGMV